MPIRRSRTSLGAYFAMARGSQEAPAMEMTKWFDTNYHYIVAEFEPGMELHVAAPNPSRSSSRQRPSDCGRRPVLLGPVPLTLLGKMCGADRGPAGIATALVEV